MTNLHSTRYEGGLDLKNALDGTHGEQIKISKKKFSKSVSYLNKFVYTINRRTPLNDEMEVMSYEMGLQGLWLCTRGSRGTR